MMQRATMQFQTDMNWKASVQWWPALIVKLVKAKPINTPSGEASKLKVNQHALEAGGAYVSIQTGAIIVPKI